MRFIFFTTLISFLFPALLAVASDIVPAATNQQNVNNEGVVQVLVTGTDEPVVVEKGEALILLAGEKIVMKPGTKVVAGGSLQAMIVNTDIKALKKKEKEQPLEMTRTEQQKVEEHNCLETAATLISPFVTKETDLFSKGADETESFKLQSTGSSGIPAESQRRVATASLNYLTTCNLQPTTFFTSTYASPTIKEEAFRVLRL